MTFQELKKLLLRYDQGRCTPEEVHRIEKAFDKIEQDAAEINPQQKTEIKARIWNNVAPPVFNAEKRFFLWPYRTVSIAASLFVLLTAGYILWPRHGRPKPIQTTTSSLHESIKVTNSTTSVQTVSLADGSRIFLEPRGEVVYTRQYATSREIHLEGEAFFEVVKDAAHPFTVYTRDVTTTVLGTTFRIKAYKEDKKITVAVNTGRVSVHTSSPSATMDSKTIEPVVLLPNQKVVYDHDQKAADIRLVDHPRMINSPAIVHYQDAPVSQILEALEKAYGVQINYQEQILSRCTLTASMSEEDLYDQLEIICSAVGATYSVAGLVIIISGRPCQ